MFKLFNKNKQQPRHPNLSKEKIWWVQWISKDPNAQINNQIIWKYGAYCAHDWGTGGAINRGIIEEVLDDRLKEHERYLLVASIIAHLPDSIREHVSIRLASNIEAKNTGSTPCDINWV